MSLFRKKCEYCRGKVRKGREVFRDIRVPAFIRTKRKAFCCSGHAGNYEKEVEEYLKNNKGGICCR